MFLSKVLVHLKLNWYLSQKDLDFFESGFTNTCFITDGVDPVESERLMVLAIDEVLSKSLAFSSSSEGTKERS